MIYSDFEILTFEIPTLKVENFCQLSVYIIFHQILDTDSAKKIQDLFIAQNESLILCTIK